MIYISVDPAPIEYRITELEEENKINQSIYSNQTSDRMKGFYLSKINGLNSHINDLKKIIGHGRTNTD